jgi:hypothetical protein
MSKPLYQTRPDGAGVNRPVDERGTSWSYAAEWPHELFEKRDGGTAARDLRTVSKGSSRGAGPQKKQGRVRRRGGAADFVHLCKHGQRSVQCLSCPAWHCACPGSPTHVCQEAA